MQPRQLFLCGPAVIFLLVRKLFIAAWAIVFCCLGSCFVLLDTHSMINFNSPTALFWSEFYGGYFQLTWQFFISSSAVVCAASAVVLCSLGRCFYLVQQLFLISSAVFLRAGHMFFVASAVVMCCSIQTACQTSTAQLPNSMAVDFCYLGSCFQLAWQLFFSSSAVVFVFSAVVLYCFGSYFFLRVRHLFSQFLRPQQLFCAASAVFCAARYTQHDNFQLPNSPILWQLFFALQAVVFSCLGSCFSMAELRPHMLYFTMHLNCSHAVLPDLWS